MRSYLRIQSPWAQLALFFCLLGAALLFTSIIGALFLVLKGFTITHIKNMDFNDPHTLGVLKFLQGLSTITIFLAPGLVFAFIVFRRDQLYFLGFHKPQKNNTYLLALLIMTVSIPFASWLGELNQHVPLAKWMVDMEKDAGKQIDAFLKVRSNADIAINLFIIALLPAICEEICFRGALQRVLIHIFRSPWAGIILTAILFSAFHMQFEGFLPRMFLGILLGVLFWYTGSLWVNMLAHFFINALQIIAVLYYPKFVDENPSVPIFAVILSGVLICAVFFIIKKQSSASFAKVYDFEKVNEHNQFIA